MNGVEILAKSQLHDPIERQVDQTQSCRQEDHDGQQSNQRDSLRYIGKAVLQPCLMAGRVLGVDEYIVTLRFRGIWCMRLHFVEIVEVEVVGRVDASRVCLAAQLHIS